MWPSFVHLCLLVLLPSCAQGVLRRTSSVAAAPRLHRLLADIKESISRAGEDAELVFTTLYSTDRRVEKVLSDEEETLGKTLAKLTAMEGKFQEKGNSTKEALEQLIGAARASNAAAGRHQSEAAQAGETFASAIHAVENLRKRLQDPSSTSAGLLEVPQLLELARRILEQHGALPRRIADALVQVPKPQPGTEVAPAQLGQTVALLGTVRKELLKSKSEVMLQLEVQQGSLAGKVMLAKTNAQVKRGVGAIEGQKAEELSLSAQFTDACLKLDRGFQSQARTRLEAKAQLVQSIRTARQQQLTVLGDAVRLLGDDPVLSLLEVSQSSAHEQSSSLQASIEASLRRRDTHDILMRIKATLDRAAPIDASSVQGVVSEMGSVLRAVESEQSQADEVRSQCEQENAHAESGGLGVKAGLALMSTAQDHTAKAIKAAKRLLKGMAAKEHALNSTLADFSQATAQAVKTLEGQSRDRSTITAAVHKATQAGLGASSDVLSLLSRLQSSLQTQETAELGYREQQLALREELGDYTQAYLRLLAEHRIHYEGSLAALQLYMSELTKDAQAQKEAIGSHVALVKEGAELCRGILKLHDQSSQRRARLSAALREVLPKLPGILAIGSASTP